MTNESVCRNCKSTSEEIRTIKSEILIKGKKIEVEAQRKVCTNCNQVKFDKILDQEFSLLAIKKYNETFGLKGEEIVDLRKSFGISQETFGKVLGIAKKTIVSYENNKAIPNDSYYTLLMSVFNDRKRLLDYADINKSNLTQYEIRKIYENNNDIYSLACDPFPFILNEESNTFNGYKKGNKEHILNVIQYVASKVKGKTKLAKTLFIADALSYSAKAESLTGVQYAAINNGPVPNQFDTILDYMVHMKLLELKIEEVYNHTQYNYFSDKLVDLKEEDKKYLDLSINFTKDKTAKKLSDLTHTLEIWNKSEIGDIMKFDLLDDFSLEDWK